MKYCKCCILPDTKPGVRFDAEGVCSACRSVELKHTIDWNARASKLKEICDEVRGKNGSGYDCIVPVSGGKDSMFQVYMMSQVYKLKTLAVIVVPHLQTVEGIENLNALVENLGVDLIKISPRPSTLQKIRKKALISIGNPNYAEHRVVFAAVARAAIFYGAPLVVWGEDIGTEFGGTVAGSSLTGSAEDLINNDLFREADFDDFVKNLIPENELFFYHHPEKAEVEKNRVKSIYLGFFLWWDGYKNYEIAKKYGFSGRKAGPLSGNIINYDNIDEKLCEIHNWLKFLKLGFWRPTDEACYQIWNGRMTRAEAVGLVKEKQYEFPIEYLDEFCEYHDISRDQYFSIQEKWRNLDIWHKPNGIWRLKEELN
ncbi:N-acetyl sugar amidotransferase [Polynucleobacter sp. UB-Raua-W9]|uniref:N-acetyl sugar amidotransferase n=1 Tax=Polynucleobacter sp. UB-Raua-W9 TaxID=1819736 RepID=UPI001BFD87A0|nr:N-acetyl sugar amidotransferase [Polynucleobacter sp. UB-Raua-W9]QWD72731.1 N-acetyl sugar amidotransferase [Polynucleobacter sp. UB-Raua-W9]